jgi:hypothetical protein
MKQLAAAIICLGFVLINTYLIMNGKEPNDWLWLGAAIAFLAAV